MICAGETLGAYRILESIGAGGMGTVYAAEHSLIGRRAAVKVLRCEFDNMPEVVERFFNEARIATSIRHPGIVEVFDFGYTPTAHPYIVMELLEGRSLAAQLAGGARLPTARALEIARRIAGALGAAHARGIVHRDLKPDNVFLVTDPEGGDDQVKLLDFGIAKLGGAAGTTTHAGVLLGTPAYMSPEQCRGAAACDHRSDLYSLGCVLYEMIAGAPPFSGDTLALLADHVGKPAPVLEAPRDVRDLVARLLAKRADDRPRSAALLAFELGGLIEACERRPPPPRSKPRLAALAAVVAAVTTMTVAWVAHKPHRDLSPAFAASLAVAAMPIALPPLTLAAPPHVPEPPVAAAPAASPVPAPSPRAAPPAPRRIVDDVSAELGSASGATVDTPVD